MRVELSLPKECDEQLESAIRMIRFYYEQQLWSWLMARDGTARPRLAKIYDVPKNQNDSCIWYGMLRAAAGKYNPLWAINYAFTQAFISNMPVNPMSLVKPTSAARYCRHGEGLYQSVLCNLHATRVALTRTVPVYQRLYHLTELSAILQVCSQITLDAVLELHWWDARKLRPRDGLVAQARVAYALSPLSYKACDFKDEWLAGRKLRAVYDV